MVPNKYSQLSHGVTKGSLEAVTTTTAGMMKAMSDMYENPYANNKKHLVKKLFNLKMTKGVFSILYSQSVDICGDSV